MIVCNGMWLMVMQCRRRWTEEQCVYRWCCCCWARRRTSEGNSSTNLDSERVDRQGRARVNRSGVLLDTNMHWSMHMLWWYGTVDTTTTEGDGLIQGPGEILWVTRERESGNPSNQSRIGLPTVMMISPEGRRGHAEEEGRKMVLIWALGITQQSKWRGSSRRHTEYHSERRRIKWLIAIDWLNVIKCVFDVMKREGGREKDHDQQRNRGAHHLLSVPWINYYNWIINDDRSK